MMAANYKIGDQVGVVDLVERNTVRDKPIAHYWRILAVRPGKDATVMRTFRRHGIDAYSPQFMKTKVIRGRKCDVVEPLFPGLIIVPDYERSIPDHASDGVIGWVMFGQFLLRLRPKDMVDIRNIEAASNVPLSKRERMYETGQLVRVVGGPFAYFTGRIERLDSGGRLSVLLDVFLRETPAVLEEGQVELADVPTGTKGSTTWIGHRSMRIAKAR